MADEPVFGEPQQPGGDLGGDGKVHRQEGVKLDSPEAHDPFLDMEVQQPGGDLGGDGLVHRQRGIHVVDGDHVLRADRPADPDVDGEVQVNDASHGQSQLQPELLEAAAQGQPLAVDRPAVAGAAAPVQKAQKGKTMTAEEAGVVAAPEVAEDHTL